MIREELYRKELKILLNVIDLLLSKVKVPEEIYDVVLSGIREVKEIQKELCDDHK